MDEIWERAVETALDGQTDIASVRTLTLDGAVKCLHGRLPPPAIFERFRNLQHLSIANIGASSLEQFPRLQNLQKLILSDNRIAGGLEFLVEAGLNSLRDLDLSNNRIQEINDLRPLAELRLVSLDLYECPVTRVKDYRSRVFGLIRSLKYLDKMDVDENERPESDDEDEDDEDEDDEGEGEDEDVDVDPGSGEIDGEDRVGRMVNNGHVNRSEGVVDVDEDEESDADEEEAETSRGVNGTSLGGLHQGSNGFRVVPVDGEEDDEDEDEGEDDESDDSVEEIEDDEDDDDDDDVVEVHEIMDSDDEEDGVEDDEDEDEDEEVDNDDREIGEPGSTGRLTSTEGEIDGHEHGEDDGNDEDDNGETEEEDLAVEEEREFEDVEDAEDEDEDNGTGYLVQPVGQVELDAGLSDMDPGNEEEEEIEEEEDDEDGEVQELSQPSSSNKRKRDEEDDNGGKDDDDIVAQSKSSKHQ